MKKENIQNNNNEKNSMSINYEGICDTAIKYAKDFEKEFDYSRQSIESLDDILQYYYEEIQKTNPAEKSIWKMAVIFGVYLGESLLKAELTSQGYIWSIDEDNVPRLKKDNNFIMSPVDKVYKRLKNGPEDSVLSFYNISIMIANGKLNLNK